MLSVFFDRMKSSKIYNADLNASYNIGAQYFVKHLLKPLR